MDHYLPIQVLESRFAVCRLAADAPEPDWARAGELLAIIRTREELSLVCEERFVPPEVKAERGWRAFQIQGPLDFALTGVLESVARPLTEAAVSLFALSTYDTDFFLVKQGAFDRALAALEQAGHQILNANLRHSTE